MNCGGHLYYNAGACDEGCAIQIAIEMGCADVSDWAKKCRYNPDPEDEEHPMYYF